MNRYFIFIVIALCIDALQGLLALALDGIFAAPATVLGGVTGCLAGKAVAGTVGCWIFGAVAGGFGTLFNPVLAPITIPIGIVLGMVIDFCISATFGSGLIVLLITSRLLPVKQFFSVRRMPFILAKYLPFFDELPFYTALTLMCVFKKVKADKKAAVQQLAREVAGIAAPLVAAPAGMNPGMEQAMRQPRLSQRRPDMEATPEERRSVEQLRPIVDGIRAPRNAQGVRGAASNPQASVPPRAEPLKQKPQYGFAA